MKSINSAKAPKVRGPYSHAIQSKNFLFLSGQLPVDPVSMNVESTDIEEQTRKTLKNIEIVLNEEGLKLSDVIKVNVYLADMSLFYKMNIVYEEIFQLHKPARTTIGVKGLPVNVLIEIDCIAEYNNR